MVPLARGFIHDQPVVPEMRSRNGGAARKSGIYGSGNCARFLRLPKLRSDNRSLKITEIQLHLEETEQVIIHALRQSARVYAGPDGSLQIDRFDEAEKKLERR